MLSRLSGNGPSSLPSSSDGPAIAGGDAAPARAAENDAARVCADEPPAVSVAAAAVDDAAAICDALPAQDAHDAAEAAAAHRFWLPNDAWSTITGFLPRADVLSLRTTSNEIRLQADDAIQSLRIRPEALPRFLESDGFKHVRNLNASLLDPAALDRLIGHLAAHPRPEMTLRLGPPCRTLEADVLRGIGALSLKGLALEIVLTGPDDLDALAACTFPVELLGMEHMTHEQLVSASNLPTLRRLATSSHVMTTDGIAARFAAHRALEALSFHVFHTTSSRALQSLASIPTLREFHVTAWHGTDLDVATARVLAANPSLEDLKVRSHGCGLDEDGCAALSCSASLTTLRLPLRAAMLALAEMRSVKHLTFDSYGNLPYPRLDARLDRATSRSIAALPSLASLSFPIMEREPGALSIILREGAASRLAFWNGNAGDQAFFDADERQALGANTRLKAWEFFIDDLQQSDCDVLLHHPTIDFVKLGGSEFTRPPQSDVALTARQG